MSLLLVDVADYGEVLIERLLEQGDEVRVIESDATVAQRWARLGTHVARGDPADADLVERAAQGIRSIVVMERRGSDLPAVLRGVAQGARLASRDIRVIVCAAAVERSSVDVLRRSGLEYVILLAGRRPGSPFRRRVPPSKLAEAIDAADDLSGEARIGLDLARPESWRGLGLKPP